MSSCKLFLHDTWEGHGESVYRFKHYASQTRSTTWCFCLWTLCVPTKHATGSTTTCRCRKGDEQGSDQETWGNQYLHNMAGRGYLVKVRSQITIITKWRNTVNTLDMYIWTKPDPDLIPIALSIPSNPIVSWHVYHGMMSIYTSNVSCFCHIHANSFPFKSNDACSATSSLSVWRRVRSVYIYLSLWNPPFYVRTPCVPMIEVLPDNMQRRHYHMPSTAQSPRFDHSKGWTK